MKRRRRGTGTILRTPAGLFRARFPFQGTGKREEIEGSPFPTREEAETALDALLAALHDAGAVRGGVTLRRLGKDCLKQRELDGYRSVDDEWNLWNLRMETWQQAGLPASSTTTGDVRAWLAAMRNKRTRKLLATSTRKNARNLLSAVYLYGVENGLVTENPCESVRIKDHGSTKQGSTFLSAAEVEALVDASFDDEPGVALKIATGMRSGELRSLRWEDVHADHITVRFGSPEAPTKNGKVRDVPILPLARRALDALALLRDQRDGVACEKVLPAISGGYRARGQVFDRGQWKKWLAKAKLTRRVRHHDLRHTCATLLLQGAWGDPWSYEAVKEMLGHSSVKVTERYARATGTLAQKAARAMTEGPSKGRDGVVDFAAQAREMLERRGSDSNRRLTVLQTEHGPHDSRGGGDVAILSRSVLEAVHAGDPKAIALALRLVDVVWPEAVARAQARTA